jgi:hypothetical protein
LNEAGTLVFQAAYMDGSHGRKLWKLPRTIDGLPQPHRSPHLSAAFGRPAIARNAPIKYSIRSRFRRLIPFHDDDYARDDDAAAAMAGLEAKITGGRGREEARGGVGTRGNVGRASRWRRSCDSIIPTNNEALRKRQDEALKKRHSEALKKRHSEAPKKRHSEALKKRHSEALKKRHSEALKKRHSEPEPELRELDSDEG